MSTPITIRTFYSFTRIEQPGFLSAPLKARMESLGIRGTVTLAQEGINATISGVQENIAAFMAMLGELLPHARFMMRDSLFGAQPFQRSKVKVKPELIGLGAVSDPTQCVGDYIDPSDWNALITTPGVIMIDTRNAYEFELGHFAGAINPGTRNFRQMAAFTQMHLDPKRDRRVAMYCTGGIRCEKYSSYLVAQGFAEVYHLKGGILAYLETVPPENSLWQGECFVFDERVTVVYGLCPGMQSAA